MTTVTSIKGKIIEHSFKKFKCYIFNRASFCEELLEKKSFPKKIKNLNTKMKHTYHGNPCRNIEGMKQEETIYKKKVTCYNYRKEGNAPSNCFQGNQEELVVAPGTTL